MASPKAKTLQQRFGFADPELSTPKHDEIMFWLEDNLINPWSLSFVDEPTKDLCNKLGHTNLLEVYEGKWEVPIYTGRNKFIIGFVDMMAQYKLPDIEWDCPGHTDKETYLMRSGGMVPNLKKPDGNYYCYGNPFEEKQGSYGCTGRKVIMRNYSSYNYAYEVKPTIRSAGELFRQLNMYLPYVTGICVVSPDTRFKSAIESQGFGFLEYTG